MELIDGTRIAHQIVAELKAEVARMSGRKPCLALVRVGEYRTVGGFGSGSGGGG